MLFESARKEGAVSSLYDTVKQNIIGGLVSFSSPFTRWGNRSFMGISQKPYRKIIGFDANALYLHCLGKDMSVGAFVRRKIDDGFKAQRRDKYMLAYDWLEWLNHSGQYNIIPKLNSGKEKKIGRFPVDGYDESSNTVFQFQGCWLTRHVHGENRAKKTRKTTAYLKRKGYKVREMRECFFS